MEGRQSSIRLVADEAAVIRDERVCGNAPLEAVKNSKFSRQDILPSKCFGGK
jgi:hypothetical protein